MSTEIPEIPAGSGKHPIPLVVLSANNLAASRTFYSQLFGWQMHPLSAELIAVIAPDGPALALRSNVPDGFPGIVPYIYVPDVDVALKQVVEAGAEVERAPWTIPTIGKLARFKDPSGTLYGLSNARPAGELLPMPQPLGDNPRPPAGSLCSLEMYTTDGAAAANFFGGLFEWGMKETIPQYMAFDPGAGIGGVFQSHTPSLPAVPYIAVTDVGTKLAEIDAAGGSRMGDEIRMDGVACFGYFTDPSGTNMGLIGP